MSEDSPTVIGARYELHRRIAKGGMAMVYLGRDTALDRAVAVKILLREFAADPKFVERFELEAKRAAKLGHPNVVGVFDWGRDGDTHYIVMEFVDGKSLSQMLRDGGPIGADRAAEIASEVAAGLHFAHQNGTIHRDCKTGNILVADDGSVKVGDFGIATALSTGAAANLTQTGAVMGTATYFSPEQAQGKTLDQRSDLYSLGVVLYEMLTGRPPFKGDGPVAIAMKHVSEAPRPVRELNPDVPVELEAITMKLLAKNPEDRYPTGADVQADLARFRQGGHTLASNLAAGAAAGVAAAGLRTIPNTDPSAATPGFHGSPNPTAPPGQVRIPASATRPPGHEPRHAQAEVAAVPPPAAPPQTPHYDVEYDDDEPRHIPWGYIAAVVLLLGVLVAMIVLLLNTLGDDGSDNAGDDGTELELVTIPSLVGLSRDDAIVQLELDGFELGPITTAQRTDVPPDQVVAQLPAAGVGLQAERGSDIALTVAVAPPEPDDVTVPGVVGFTEEEARDELTRAGFEVEAVGIESEEPPGQVVSQTPEEGLGAPPGSTVSIEVSTGPGAKEIPSLEGLTGEEARVALEAEGFVALFVEANSTTVAQGFVIASDPAWGSLADAGSEIVVTVSVGPARVVVPDVKGRGQQDAADRLALEGLLFTPDTCLITDPETQEPGTIIEQTPAGGSDAFEGDTVVICVGVEPDPTPEPTPGDDGGGDDGGDGPDGGGDDPPPTPPETIDDDGL